MFKKPMKMRNLEVWGIPSYIVDIWEKHYSPYLLAVQEEAVREYGVLDFDGKNKEGRMQYAPTGGMDSRFRGNDRERGGNDRERGGNDRDRGGNDRERGGNDRDRGGNDPSEVRVHGASNNNLLVLSPTSSGKTFIGEMAAITQAIHNKKAIYLVPLRSLAEEKYRHFEKLYGGIDCKIDILISSRDRREDDRKIIKGEYQVAVMVYEKFNYFLLKYPQLLKDVSLIIIDELQMIHDPVRGPLLERMIVSIRKSKAKIKFIGLSAYLENEISFLNWFPAHHLLSYKRPVELRKGIMRGGTFRYVTHNKEEYGEEKFFKVEEGEDTSYEDCLKNTISYFVKKDEPALLFFPTKKETRRWAGYLAKVIDAPKAEGAIAELSRMEETRSRDELLYLLEKGMAYHNADLSWEERNLVETYLRKGEIKIICATTTLAMGINLPFKNVILSGEKYVSDDGDHKSSYRTGLSLADVENMGGRSGRLDWKKEEFGRVIFLADSLFKETMLQNVYFKLMKKDRKRQREMISEAGELYVPVLEKEVEIGKVYRPVKEEKDFDAFLLRAVVGGKDSKDKLKNYLRGVTPNSQGNGSYWLFDFKKEGDLEEEIDRSLKRLLEYNFITKDLSATEEGILICAKGINIKTYLHFKEYLENKKGKMSNLEIITLLALSEEGKRFYLPFPQFNYRTDRYNRNNWKGQYYRKMKHLILEVGEEYKEVYQDIFDFNGENNSLDTEDFLSVKKTVFLYEWIGEKEIRRLEEEHKIYEGSIQKLGEGFSWLADALGGVAESLGWDKDKEKPGSKENKENKESVSTEEDEIKKDNLGKIKILSERLAWGVEEKGLKLARIHVPGLSRSYIGKLLREGYDDKECFKELSEEELAKVVPVRLAERIKRRFSALPSSVIETKTQKLITNSSSIPSPHPYISQLKTENRQQKTVLQINIYRPDRIIFEGKEIKVTAKEFSLIYLLSQNRGKTITYNDLINNLWTENEYSTYVQITSHLYKIRRVILKTIGNNKKNKKKVKDILKVISRRGIMLNLEEDKLKIN